MAGDDLQESVGLVHDGRITVRRYEGTKVRRYEGLRKYRREGVQERFGENGDYKSFSNTKMSGRSYAGAVSWFSDTCRPDAGRQAESNLLVPYFIYMYLTWI